MIRAIIFDLGGVLVRTEDLAPRTQLAQSLGLAPSALEEIVYGGPSGIAAQKGVIPLEQHWENVRADLDIPEQEMDTFLGAFWGGDRLDRDLVDLIRTLRGPYRTGLLSNAFSDLRHYLTQVWQIADAFDRLVISAEVGLVKPDPRIYHLALERLEVTPQEAVFIDDFPENVAGAREVGITAILFQGAGQAQAELHQLLEGSAADFL